MTYQEKLDKFTFLIPIFNLKDERLDNFKFILSKIKEITDNILVVEQVKNKKDRSEAYNFTKLLGIEYLPVKVNDDHIHKSKIINRGTDHINTQYIWVNDADCYLKFQRAIDLIDFSSDFIQPYIYAKKLSANDSQSIRNGKFINVSYNKNDQLISGYGSLSFLYKKDKFKKIGQMNESAVGWGYEDQELSSRVKAFNFVKTIKNIKAIHLYHPESTFIDPLINNCNNISNMHDYSDFCIFCAGLSLPANIPNIDKFSNKKSVLVDSRIYPHTHFTIKNAIQKLGEGWGHIVITSNESYSDMIDICKNISPDIEVRKLPISTRNDYNNLFLTKQFWESLNCEFCFIYQYDSIFLNDFDNSYLQYDYVGAPWSDHADIIQEHYNLDRRVSVGNGGFSLRKISAMIECLDMAKSCDLNINNNIHKELDQIPEDIYFSALCKNKPTIKKASLFSIDCDYKSDANLSQVIGVHAIYRDRDYKQKIEQCLNIADPTQPIVYIISGVKAGGAKLYIDNFKKSLNNSFYLKEVYNKEDLKNIRPIDTLIINHLVGSDINIEDIVKINDRVNIHLIVHDFYFLNNCDQSIVHNIPNIDDSYINSSIIKFFERVNSIIVNSLFTLDKYKSIDIIKDKIFLIPPVDLLVTPGTIQSIQPKIIDTINIGIITDLTVCKGYNLYAKIFEINQFKDYKIIFHVFGKTDTSLPILNGSHIRYHGGYDEVEIFNLLKIYEISGLLLLNDLNTPETYSYAATKCIISGLPTLFSNIGSLKYRLFYTEGIDTDKNAAIDYTDIKGSFIDFIDNKIIKRPKTQHRPNIDPQKIQLNCVAAKQYFTNIIVRGSNIINFSKIKYFCISSPKSGSTTIYNSIVGNGISTDNVLHAHGPADFRHRYNCDLDDAVYESAKSNPEISIFDAYREPIERILSCFFYKYVPDKNFINYTTNNLFKDKLYASLGLIHSHEFILNKIFKINDDILYDNNVGHSYYRFENINFYKLRLRDVDNWDGFFQKIIGIKDFKINSANVNQNKQYLSNKNNFNIPLSFFNDLFYTENCQFLLRERRYLKTFLNITEYDEYKSKWESRIL